MQCANTTKNGIIAETHCYTIVCCANMTRDGIAKRHIAVLLIAVEFILCVTVLYAVDKGLHGQTSCNQLSLIDSVTYMLVKINSPGQKKLKRLYNDDYYYFADNYF